MFDSGRPASDEDQAASSERAEAKRVVTRIDPQWADLFDRATEVIARSRLLQRKLTDVLAIAARFLPRKRGNTRTTSSS